MNAASLITAKGLILALGGSLTLTASPATAPAAPATSYIKVDLGTTATYPLTGTYVNPPTGAVTLGSVPFNLANIALLTSGTKLDLPVSTTKPTSVSLLVNSAYGFTSLGGQTVGRVHLTFSDGTAQDTDVVGGALVREWWLSSGYLSTLTSTASKNVWQGQGQPATGIGTATAVIDMLTATVKPTTASLSTVSLQNVAGAPFDLMVSGVTVAYQPTVIGGGTGDDKDNKGNNDKDNKDVNRVNPPTAKPGKSDPEKRDEKDGKKIVTAPKTADPKHTVQHQTDHESPGATSGRSND